MFALSVTPASRGSKGRDTKINEGKEGREVVSCIHN